MKHKQKNNDGLLSPTEYWEMKLGIKHITEKARYKKLCNYRLSKDDKAYLDGAYYITFSDWDTYINDKLSVLDTKELFEYSKYINGRLEKENIFSGLFTNFMVPLIISVITPIVLEMLTEYLTESYNHPLLDFLTIIIRCIICAVTFITLTKIVVENAQDNKASHLFYKDMHKIITSKLPPQYKQEPKE